MIQAPCWRSTGHWEQRDLESSFLKVSWSLSMHAALSKPTQRRWRVWRWEVKQSTTWSHPTTWLVWELITSKDFSKSGLNVSLDAEKHRTSFYKSHVSAPLEFFSFFFSFWNWWWIAKEKTEEGRDIWKERWFKSWETIIGKCLEAKYHVMFGKGLGIR